MVGSRHRRRFPQSPIRRASQLVVRAREGVHWKLPPFFVLGFAHQEANENVLLDCLADDSRTRKLAFVSSCKRQFPQEVCSLLRLCELRLLPIPVRLVIYLAEPTFYRSFYWHTQPLSVFVGCVVVWEIYRRALGRFPGAARMARNLLVLILLILVAKVLANIPNVSAGWLTGTTAELERNLRAVQAVMLMGLITVIGSYRIPLGRNLWGMLLGYGLFVSTSVINLTLRVLLGDSFQTVWQYLQPILYLTVLCVWCVTLWSYQATPLPETEPKIEHDYQLLAAATKKSLVRARAYLGRAIRP